MGDQPRSGRGPSRWIWNRGIAALCDRRIPDEFPDGATYVHDPRLASHNVVSSATVPIEAPERFDDVGDGDVIWVRASWLPSFVAQVLPRLTAEIVLVTGDSDSSLPSTAMPIARALLDSPRVRHWYTQNYDGTAPRRRVSPIPLGLDLHTLSQRPEWGEPVASPRQQEEALEAIVSALPSLDARIPKIYLDFSWQRGIDTPTGRLRAPLIERLASHPLVVHQEAPLPRSEMWRRKGEYAFSLSPRGLGLDCHRTWEALVLGQVVLVPSSSVDPLFDGLRAVPVANWDDLTLDHLVRWLALALPVPDTPAALTNEHWIQRMRRGRDRTGVDAEVRAFPAGD